MLIRALWVSSAAWKHSCVRRSLGQTWTSEDIGVKGEMTASSFLGIIQARLFWWDP